MSEKKGAFAHTHATHALSYRLRKRQAHDFPWKKIRKSSRKRKGIENRMNWETAEWEIVGENAFAKREDYHNFV